MTIRKKIALSIVTASLASTVAFAGTITNTGSVGLVGKEKLTISDVNVSNAFRSVGEVVYTPTNIPATSLKNPIFKFTFAGGSSLVVDGNTSVWECQDGNESNTSIGNWRRVAGDMQVSGTNSEIASFNAVDSTIYVYNNKKYVVADNNSSDITDTNVSITLAQGSTADLALQAELYSGDSQAQADLAPATTIAKVGNEYVGSVTQKFDARIDAANSFFIFYDRNSDGSTKKEDDAVFNLHKNATLPGASLGVNVAYIDVLFDQNTSSYITSQLGFTTLTDLNVTHSVNGFNTASSAFDSNTTLALTVTGTDKIEKTKFGAHAYVKSGTNIFDLITKATDNAGEWTIYGYNAQIPNVASTPSVDVVMKFTNRSTLDTNIYLTLIDQDGTIVTLDSVNDGLAALPANTTGVYKASDLVALITDPDFNKNDSFSVEVSIPTTPSSVYGMASFKNLTLGQFKDLPIYNSSEMTY